MTKMTVSKSEIPRLYVEQCVIGGLSQAKLARSIGIGPGRMCQLLKQPEMQRQIEELKQKAAGDPALCDTQLKADKIFEALQARFNLAVDKKDDLTIVKLAGPVLEALRVRGLMNKVGISQPAPMGIEARDSFLKEQLDGLIKIIVQFVPNDKQQECLVQLDRWVSGTEDA